LKRSQKHPQGGRIQREGAVPLSILMPVDPSTDKGTRVAFRVVDGEKVRVARASGARLEGERKARAERKPAEQEAKS
jgi:large subunit ribosomal protein L24